MLFHVVTLIMGVFFTVRKLDVRRREAKDYPNVEPAAFQEWKSMALRAYNLGAFACFGRVALDVANQYALSRVAPWTVIQVGGGVLFVAWVGCVVYSFVLSSRARTLQEKAKIILLPAAPPPEPR
jgi:hypothetical protein